MFDVFDHILPVVFPAANATQRGHDPGIGVHFCQQFLVTGHEFLAVQTGQGESFDMGHSKFPYRGRTVIKYRRIMNLAILTFLTANVAGRFLIDGAFYPARITLFNGKKHKVFPGLTRRPLPLRSSQIQI